MECLKYEQVLTEEELKELSNCLKKVILNDDKFLVILNKLLAKGFTSDASSILEKLMKKESFKNVKSKMKFLSKKINEINEFEKLDIDDKNVVLSFINSGNRLFLEHRCRAALDVYMEGLEITNFNIFNYYIGKMYYKLHNYKSAIKYFKEYSKNGVAKLSKINLYLSKIYVKTYQDNELYQITTDNRILSSVNNFTDNYAMEKEFVLKNQYNLYF